MSSFIRLISRGLDAQSFSPARAQAVAGVRNCVREVVRGLGPKLLPSLQEARRSSSWARVGRAGRRVSVAGGSRRRAAGEGRHREDLGRERQRCWVQKEPSAAGLRQETRKRVGS